MPRTEQGPPQLQYDMVWIGGGHGDVDGKGIPRQFNGCDKADVFQGFIADLVAIGIRTPALVVDTCFSLASLPQLAPLLTENGVFAGWSCICTTTRNELLASHRLPALVQQTETALAEVTTASSSQVVYLMRDRVLLRHAQLTASVGGLDADDLGDAKATLAHVRSATWQGKPLIATDQPMQDRDAFIHRLHQL
ncbi:hypothetical protein J7357_06490 [Xanthomonas sp. D-109]|nr:hypothetical protein [Xanthomonas sp. D-109]